MTLPIPTLANWPKGLRLPPLRRRDRASDMPDPDHGPVRNIPPDTFWDCSDAR